MQEPTIFRKWLTASQQELLVSRSAYHSAICNFYNKSNENEDPILLEIHPEPDIEFSLAVFLIMQNTENVVLLPNMTKVDVYEIVKICIFYGLQITLDQVTDYCLNAGLGTHGNDFAQCIVKFGLDNTCFPQFKRFAKQIISLHEIRGSVGFDMIHVRKCIAEEHYLDLQIDSIITSPEIRMKIILPVCFECMKPLGNDIRLSVCCSEMLHTSCYSIHRNRPSKCPVCKFHMTKVNHHVKCRLVRDQDYTVRQALNLHKNFTTWVPKGSTNCFYCCWFIYSDSPGNNVEFCLDGDVSEAFYMSHSGYIDPNIDFQ